MYFIVMYSENPRNVWFANFRYAVTVVTLEQSRGLLNFEEKVETGKL